MEDFSGVLRGLGKSFVSMLISLIGSCAFRVLWVLVVFPMVGGLQIIYYSYPISWVITAATLILFSVGLSNKLIKEKRKREQGEK
jgi:Na+-driven multidrug efflux pump